MIHLVGGRSGKGRGKSGGEQGCLVIFIVPVAIFILYMCCGCAGMLAKALVPDVDLHLSDEELTYMEKINKDYNTTLITLSEVEDKKKAVAFGKLVRNGNKRANNIQPSAAERATQQYMRMVGREGVEEHIGTGIEWSKQMIGTVAGGATGVGGLSGLLAMFMRKNARKGKTLKVVNAKLDDTEKAKIKTALEHTGLEGEVS